MLCRQKRVAFLSAFVSFTPLVATALPDIAVRLVCNPSAAGASVRSGAALEGTSVIEMLPNGSSVRGLSREIAADSVSWLKIEYRRGSERVSGFIAEGDLLDRCSAPAAAASDELPAVRTAFSTTWLPVTSAAPPVEKARLVQGSTAGGITRAEIQNKTGFVDSNGSWIIEPILQNALDFSEGVASVQIGNRIGIVDKSGNWIVEPILAKWARMEDGVALVTLSGTQKYGFIDPTGRWVVPPIYDNASPFRSGLAAVGRDGKNGFVDRKGRVVIDLKFEYAREFVGDFGLVKIDAAYAYIDRTGRVIVAGLTSVGGDIVTDGIARAYIGAKGGYVDLTTGKWIIEPQFESTRPFYEGLAAVNDNGRGAFIDKTGRFMFPDKTFTWVESFSNGKAPVQVGDKSGVIDREGRYVVELH